MKDEDKIALIDLDNTLADYSGQLDTDISQVFGANYKTFLAPSEIEGLRHIITNQYGWFAKLPKTSLGTIILDVLMRLGFQCSILSQAPMTKPQAWMDKVTWCQENLPDEVKDIHLVRDKSLVYGKILVDDWPEYVEPWLENRPRGLVIMPETSENKGFTHDRVIRVKMRLGVGSVIQDEVKNFFNI